MEGNNGFPVALGGDEYNYRCTVCEELISPADLVDHMLEEREKPDYPGKIRFLLELGPFTEEEI